MKKKSMFLKLAAAACLFALLVTCAAAEEGVFPLSRTYADGGFTDVSEDAWYYQDVKSAYELSLINGMGEGIFAPDSTMTVAQGITLAVRMNRIYHKEDVLVQSADGNWYDVYVSDALAKGIITDGQFVELDREIKRHEMASIFVKALPAESYPAINSVDKIPDVASGAAYGGDVRLLYNAGVVMGNDLYGTFSPNASIIRSEVSAIINRVAIPANRLQRTLLTKRGGNAYYLIDDTNDVINYSNIISGWSLDNRGGQIKTTEKGQPIINDISDEYPTALIRELTYTDSGDITLETSFTFLSASIDGFYVALLDANKQPAYKLYTENNAFYVVGDGGAPKKLFDNSGARVYTMRVNLSFDTMVCETIVDWVSYGTSPLLSDNIKTFQFGSTDQGIVSAKNGLSKLYVNYAVNETFDMAFPNQVPYGWISDVSSEQAKSLVEKNEYVLSLPADGGKAAAIKNFNAQYGTVCFESLFFMPRMATGFTAGLFAGDDAALEFSSNNGSFYANGTELRTHREELWYRLRFEINLETKTALIKINGKEAGTVGLQTDAAFLDSLRLTLEGIAGAKVCLDDIKVYNLVEYDDYVPAPVRPEGEEKYNIGVNVCSLWRNGMHGGWDPISPFDEIRPLIGYYDEGIPEVADWEIKWMVESGIDFQLFCWYSSERNAPIKTTLLSAAIHDGYFNAKYSNEMKFALLWEAANAQHPAGSEAFRKYFVPYWVEYFFTDERYMTIDNKLVIAVFGANQLITDFGSPAGVKAELDYLRQVARDLGFDGAIIIDTAGSVSQTSVDCGFDGVSAYGWGKAGYQAEHNKQRIKSNQDKNLEHVIPTVSVGFNDIGWHGTRSPNMSVSDYRLIHEWVRDVALKKYENATEDWKKNLLILSTWNEYGEGTYVMPSGLNEFGYLNVIREVYTDGKTPLSVKPTENQLSRLGYLYPQDRAIIRPLGWKEDALPTTVLHTWNLADSTEHTRWDWRQMNYVVKDGAVTATSTGDDPVVAMRDSSGINIDKAYYLRIKMQAPLGNMVQVYFTTAEDPNWDEAKSFKTTTTTDDMHEYYIGTQQNPKWIGELRQLRFDPVASGGVEFKVVSIELVGPDEANMKKISINDLEQEFDVELAMDNGYHMIPFNPGRGISFALGLHYEWNKKDSVLTLYGKHRTVIFTMGSSTVLIDGAPQQLECTPHLDDGLPMLPIEFLAQIFEYELETAENHINIISDSEVAHALRNRVANHWEFDLAGDNEGWGLAGISGASLDGSFYGIAIERGGEYPWDPVMMSPPIAIDASEYKTIVVAMKHDFISERPQRVGIYFKTPTLDFAQERFVALPIEGESSGDEYIVYEFDMSQNSDWNGKIDQIRFDPFDCEGTFYIDYIRIMK